MTPQNIQNFFIPKNHFSKKHKKNEITISDAKKNGPKISKNPLGTALFLEVFFPWLMESWTGNVLYSMGLKGAQWLSGKVLDSRPRVRASPASLRCVLKQEH